MDALQDWTGRVAPLLGVDPEVVAATGDDVLDMVRDVAHGVVRPAAPLTAYQVGLAAGRAAAPGAAGLARGRPAPHGVVRPAAPLTAYLVGLAAGRAAAQGADTVAAVREALTRVDALLSERGPQEG
ncbi:DUF6457 domain-containing protein [Cellulomonas wangsupingiae]|uniref:DUF6457 domain-containing protein n=1 Tax=Cellulomonas wangsupingiae TaxID=2968085 RepID=UPI00202F46BE|nr:DUF6457 domain-containing protein [Cellulomonas wangsupingiae]MCM0640474.1 DUF6457 domain-containing protein [Cellulomonas wangsupingiae]